MQQSESKQEESKTKAEKELHIVIQEAKGIIEAFISKEKSHIKRFKLQHRIFFAFVVFFAINLIWYGMWTIVSETPFIKNPFVALIIGAIILVGTGYFYENFISVNFMKKKQQQAKKIKKRDQD